jgi:hypothetical protein
MHEFFSRDDEFHSSPDASCGALQLPADDADNPSSFLREIRAPARPARMNRCCNIPANAREHVVCAARTTPNNLQKCACVREVE